MNGKRLFTQVNERLACCTGIFFGVFGLGPFQSQQAATGSQRHIVEQAYIIPLYTRTMHKALSNEVKDAAFSSMTGNLELYDAYINVE